MSRIHWEEVGQFLKKNADKGVGLVGSLLTGNYAGAIAQGISMVSGATGTDDPQKSLAILQSDPKAMVELRRIETKHIATMAQIEIDGYQIEVEDRKSARGMKANADMWPQIILSGIFLAGYFTLMFMLFSGNVKISEDMQSTGNILLGVMTGGFPQMMAFWYGSSHGSKKKDKS